MNLILLSRSAAMHSLVSVFDAIPQPRKTKPDSVFRFHESAEDEWKRINAA